MSRAVGVHVITDPPGTTDVVLKVALGIQVDLPFLIVELHLNVQMFAPHFLNGRGNGAMVFGGVENDGGFGESFSIGVTGLGKQGFGGLDVGRDASACGVTSRAGRVK